MIDRTLWKVKSLECSFSIEEDHSIHIFLRKLMKTRQTVYLGYPLQSYMF